MKFISIFCAVSISLGISDLAIAQVPHAFTAGTPAKASEVNDNFAALNTRINTNEAAISVLGNSTNGGTGLVVVDAMQNEIGPLLAGLFFEGNGLNTAVALIELEIGGSIEKFYLWFDPLGADLRILSRNIYFAGANCSGTAYIERRINLIPVGLPFSVDHSTHEFFVSTMNADTVISNFSSVRNSVTGACTNSITAVQPANYEYFVVTDIIDLTTLYSFPLTVVVK